MSIAHSRGADDPAGQDPGGGARDAGSKKSFRRIAAASLVGTLIEGYDFVLYSLAAALVFPQVFFPSLGPSAGVVASLATLGVAFVARPIGAVLFGHFGDRLGRKKMLVYTILGMGAGTTLMGAVPSAETIGVAAPIIIVILRFIQGIAVGGEWAGSVLFVTEHAPAERRGLYAVFPQIGHSLPNALSAGTFLIVGLLVSPEVFVEWGWRIPFLASGVLVLVALYIRLKVEESPVFTRQQAQPPVDSVPIVSAFREQPWIIVRVAGVALMSLTFVYVGNAFLANFGVSELGFTRNEVLSVGVLSGLVFAGFTVVSAFVSDRFGRRPVIGGAQLIAVVWSLLLFPILSAGSLVVYGVVLCVTMMLAGLAYGAIGAFVPEQFPARYRYTAAGVSYNITGVVGGGVAPLVAPVIIEAQGTMMFGVVLAVLALLSAAATFSLRETSRDRDFVPQ